MHAKYRDDSGEASVPLGAGGTFTVPGQATSFTFRALNPGLYVYPCAVAPVGMHVGNGMYGLILVEPKKGLAEVDRESYLMQGEFYTDGKTGEQGPALVRLRGGAHGDPRLRGLQRRRRLADRREGADRAAGREGAAVRRQRRPEPGLLVPRHRRDLRQRLHRGRHVQTTLVPAGGAAITEFRVDVPGTYILVDHSILRAFDKGALGMLQVSGNATPISTDGGSAGGGAH